MKEISLTPLELLTLLALARLGGDTYAVPLREEIRRCAARTAAVATVYGALESLHRRGFARPRIVEPRPEPGGRARRHYVLTSAGRERLWRERERTLAAWSLIALDSSAK